MASLCFFKHVSHSKLPHYPIIIDGENRRGVGVLYTNQIPGTAALFGAFAAIGSFFIVLGIVVYIFEGFVFYRIYKKAGVKYPWLSWVPIAQMVPFFWTIKLSAWNTLWVLVPSVTTLVARSMGAGGVVFILGIDLLVTGIGIWWQARFLKAFGISPQWLWLAIGLLIPFLNVLVAIGYIVLICIIAFHANVRYRPDFDRKF
jgi:hypothetical protein